MIVVDHDSSERIQALRQTAALQFGERRWWPGGKPHPIQDGAFGPVIGVGRVLSADQKRLHRLTEEDAERLGFPSLAEFKDDYRRRYRKEHRWHPQRQIWIVRFVYSGVPEEYKQSNLLDLLSTLPL